MKPYKVALVFAAVFTIGASVLALGSTTPAVRAQNPAAPDACPTPIKKNWVIKGNCGTTAGTHFVGTTDNQALVFKTNNGERMRIGTNGNVGIGTANPSAKLQVSANTKNSGNNTAEFAAPGIGPNASHIHWGTTGDWYIRSAAANGKVVLQDSGGKVGIGTSNPAAALDIASGRIRLSSGLGDVEFTEVADLIAHATDASPVPTDPAFRVDTGTGLTRAFTILNNGNVGIGETNPAARLIVKGDGQTFLLRVQNQAGTDMLKLVNHGVLSFGALYSIPSTSHLCYKDTGGLAITSCNSAAEYVPSIDVGKGFPETADLVSIAPAVKNPYGDEHGPFVVQKSATPCDSNLLGFIVNPESGADGKKLNEHYLPLAIYGYFPAKVTTANGFIKRGDALTSSSKPGYAMKATGACKIIGYALEDANVDGTVQVFSHLSENSASQVAALKQENETLREMLARMDARIKALEQTSPVAFNPFGQAP